MNRDHYQREAVDAGGGTTNVPFYEFVAPNLYVGEALAALVLGVSQTIEGGIAAFNRWRWERATRKALQGLSDATLTDIGVSRSEIGAVARAAASNPTFKPARRSPWNV
jgi:uncharacterized protein YjiS (DUF1127 family)